MKNIFINSTEKRLRAGWRILAFIVIFIPLNIGISLGFREIFGSLKGGGTLWFTLLGISSTLAVYISRKFIDKERFLSLGLKLDKIALLDIISGVINSALVMAAIYFTMLFLGLIEFNGFSWWTDHAGPDVQWSSSVIPIILAVFWEFIVVAWWEELVFRGIIYQNLTKGLGLIWAVGISSVLFGVMHAANPNATVLSTLLIVLMTPQLIYAYLKTGNLWLPMGLHLGWNFFQASVFGFASSGQVSPSLIQQTAIGPDWLSGGVFGAEGSVFVIPYTILSFFLIHWWVKYSKYPNQKFFDFSEQSVIK